MRYLKKYMKYIIVISFLGELYFYPFQGEFRFSVGVVAFGLVLLLGKDLKEIVLGLLTGTSVLFLRVLINILSSGESIYSIIKIDLPGGIYYIVFSILAYFLSIRKNRDNPIITIPLLFFIDGFSNILESLIRDSLNYQLFKYILLIGFIRALMTYGIFVIFRNQEFLIRKSEHQKRYTQLNHIISNIQAEMFYLKKSMKDIENLMGKSYNLYEENKDNENIKEKALDIAREVHEVKKDYHRVVGGLENFLQEFAREDSMNFKDISYIIEDNINRYIDEMDKDIRVEFKVKDNISIKNYYLMFTILNNLIINSIHAIEKQGKISITEEVIDTDLILRVEDNGKGIEEDILDYLFNPGFTTKFDDNTGESSTGIGLSHVQNIVESLNGRIDVKSNINSGTEFKIIIPMALLRG